MNKDDYIDDVIEPNIYKIDLFAVTTIINNHLRFLMRNNPSLSQEELEANNKLTRLINRCIVLDPEEMYGVNEALRYISAVGV